MQPSIASRQYWQSWVLIGPNDRCRRSSSASRSSSARMSRIVRRPSSLTDGSTQLLHDLVGDRVVRVHVLDLVGLLEHVDQPEHPPGGLIVDPGLLQRGPDRHQVGRLTDHLVGLAHVTDLLGPGIKHGHQHVVLAERVRLGHDDHALAAEQVRDRPGVGHGAAVAGQRRPDLRGCPVPVVGQALDQERDAARGVTLVRHRLVRGAACLEPGAAANRPVDVVVRHRTALGLLHGVVQRRVGAHVRAAAARRHLDILDELGEELAPPGVDDGLLVLRGGPLGVAAHRCSLTMSVKILCTRLSWVSSGWNAVASAGPWRTATILPVRGSVARISTPGPTSSTQGARMKTARNGGPPAPVMSMSLSNESAWRPNAFRLTVMSIAPRVSWSLARSTSLLASRIIPAHDPKTGIPAPIRSRSGRTRSKIAVSFQIVVDSPPGMMRPSTTSSSAGRRTATGSAPAAVIARRCSATSPCRASTPTVALPRPARAAGPACADDPMSAASLAGTVYPPEICA